MSGSGNSGFGSRGVQSTNCRELSISGLVASPKPLVVNKLGVGNYLNVELIEGVVHLLFHEEIVGGFTSNSIDQLIKCLSSGIKYVGQIQSIDHGQMQVRIFHVNEPIS